MQNENDARALESGFTNKNVAYYYDYTRRFYRVFWHGKTNALHYGFHDETTKTPADELLRTIELTAQAGEMRETDVVADLGCGVGGSAFWIAKNRGAQVHGITLSESQYKKAVRLNEEYGLQEKTHFKVGDYFNTGYETDAFDVAFGIESLCYGQYDVERLVTELYRITKPGGRVVVTDGFLGKEVLTSSEEKAVDQFCEGFVLNKMITPQVFMNALREVGFMDVKFEDWTEQVLPTADRMYALTKKWHAFIILITKLRLVPDIILKNNVTGLVQRDLFKQRTLVYGCITAKK
jgi:cyclopropane fatty-acyl-phospholipid synthase-like methyltransferase